MLGRVISSDVRDENLEKNLPLVRCTGLTPMMDQAMSNTNTVSFPSRTALDLAFRQTTYRVHAPTGTIDLRIGEQPDALSGHSWAFLTAYNPLPRNLEDAENQRRQQTFLAQLQNEGRTFYLGEGRSDDGSWPPEPSFLVLGVTLEQATALAATYEQLAFVYGARGGLAELVWTQDAITSAWARALTSASRSR